jgi:hypothetical protein
MVIAVEDNPNCDGCGVMRFRTLSLPRRVASVVYHAGEGEPCRVTGWGPNGPTPAVARKVADSGDGIAWLVSGGEWGVRLKAASDPAAWALEAEGQWGEPYLVVAGRDDMTFA